jgi:hypothetical protein
MLQLFCQPPTSSVCSICLCTHLSASNAPSVSNRNPHPVNSFRTWTCYLIVLYLQSVTDNLMETDQVGDSGRRGNPKERMPGKGLEPTE